MILLLLLLLLLATEILSTRLRELLGIFSQEHTVPGCIWFQHNPLHYDLRSLNMGLMPSVRSDIVAFLNPALCANTKQKVDSKESPCQNAASFVCVCKLIQVCCLLFSKDASHRLVLRKNHKCHI